MLNTMLSTDSILLRDIGRLIRGIHPFEDDRDPFAGSEIFRELMIQDLDRKYQVVSGDAEAQAFLADLLPVGQRAAQPCLDQAPQPRAVPVIRRKKNDDHDRR